MFTIVQVVNCRDANKWNAIQFEWHFLLWLTYTTDSQPIKVRRSTHGCWDCCCFFWFLHLYALKCLRKKPENLLPNKNHFLCHCVLQLACQIYSIRLVGIVPQCQISWKIIILASHCDYIHSNSHFESPISRCYCRSEYLFFFFQLDPSLFLYRRHIKKKKSVFCSFLLWKRIKLRERETMWNRDNSWILVMQMHCSRCFWMTVLCATLLAHWIDREQTTKE